MIDSRALREEALRIHWRQKILSGQAGEKALKRIMSMVNHNFPERFIT